VIDPTVLRPSGRARRRPAVCLLSGAVVAMDRAPELAGVRWLPVSEHRFKKEKHQRNEELTANSRRCFAGAEERREELAVRGKALGLRRDPV